MKRIDKYKVPSLMQIESKEVVEMRRKTSVTTNGKERPQGFSQTLRNNVSLDVLPKRTYKVTECWSELPLFSLVETTPRTDKQRPGQGCSPGVNTLSYWPPGADLGSNSLSLNWGEGCFLVTTSKSDRCKCTGTVQWSYVGVEWCLE